MKKIIFIVTLVFSASLLISFISSCGILETCIGSTAGTPISGSYSASDLTLIEIKEILNISGWMIVVFFNLYIIFNLFSRKLSFVILIISVSVFLQFFIQPYNVYPILFFVFLAIMAYVMSRMLEARFVPFATRSLFIIAIFLLMVEAYFTLFPVKHIPLEPNISPEQFRIVP